MNEVLEFKKTIDVIDHDLDQYDDIDFFPEKTKRAKEMLAKWGLPKEIEAQILAEERAEAIEAASKMCEKDAAVASI